jgi:predicted amidohydrolase YtcJ
VIKVSTKIIKCGNLIDGTGRSPIKDTVIVVNGSIITAVGKQPDIKTPKEAYIIDASGKTVIPGFIDSHLHFLSTGYRLNHLQLSQADSIVNIQERLKAYIEANKIPREKWIQGRGWDDQYLREKRYPNKYDLDKEAPDNPTALTRVCGHMIVLNSKALEACNISKDTPNPKGGVIDKDDQKEPTGILRDARGLVRPFIPPPTYEELRKGLRKAVQLAHSLGVTSIHDASRPDESKIHLSTSPYIDAHVENDLLIRAHVMTGYPRRKSGDEWLSFGTLKIGIDGSMGAQTALLYEPYYNDPTTYGVYVGDTEKNLEYADNANQQDAQIAVHAIGDKAITEAINTISQTLEYKSTNDHRHRIEHFEYPNDTDIERAREYNIIASMQPNFVGEWAWPNGMYETRLGEARNRRSNPYRILIDKGYHIAFGSDGMPFHPLYGIWSAVNHPITESRISVEEAVKSYTLEGAYATFEEDIKGSIEVGKLADITILHTDITSPDFKIENRDPIEIEEIKSAIKKTHVHMTILNGEIVYENKF